MTVNKFRAEIPFEICALSTRERTKNSNSESLSFGSFCTNLMTLCEQGLSTRSNDCGSGDSWQSPRGNAERQLRPKTKNSRLEVEGHLSLSDRCFDSQSGSFSKQGIYISIFILFEPMIC